MAIEFIKGCVGKRQRYPRQIPHCNVVVDGDIAFTVNCRR